MSKKDEALKLALEALETCDVVDYEQDFDHEKVDEAITALREALAEQPAQQETSNESAYQRGYLDGMAKPCVECADRKLKEMAKHPSVQQEADLSGLKPTTQEVVKGWIEDGTFIQRAIGAMQEQEAENMRLEKMVKDQPAQQEQGDSICQGNDGCPTEKAVLQRFWRGQSIPDEHYPAWFKPAQQEPVAIVDDSGVIVVCSYHYKPGDKLYTSPPAQRKPLTDEEIEQLSFKHLDVGDGPYATHFVIGSSAFARAIEAACGIKENT